MNHKSDLAIVNLTNVKGECYSVNVLKNLNLKETNA